MHMATTTSETRRDDTTQHDTTQHDTTHVYCSALFQDLISHNTPPNFACHVASILDQRCKFLEETSSAFYVRPMRLTYWYIFSNAFPQTDPSPSLISHLSSLISPHHYIYPHPHHSCLASLLHLYIPRERVIRSPLISQCCELLNSLLEWDRLSSILSRCIITISHIDLPAVHFLIPDHYWEISTDIPIHNPITYQK